MLLISVSIDSERSPSSFQNAFNASMYPEDIDPPADSTCTTCQFSEDFSNYWTAVL